MENLTATQSGAGRKDGYAAPLVDVTEIGVEQGFAISVPGTLPGFGDGGSW